MENENGYYDFLNPSKWDPLFGELPWGDADERDPVYQACKLILDARSLLGALPLECAGMAGAPSTREGIIDLYPREKARLCTPLILWRAGRGSQAGHKRRSRRRGDIYVNGRHARKSQRR